MRTRVTLRRPSGTVDLVLSTDARATVGEVAAALFEGDPANLGKRAPATATLHVAAGAHGSTLPPETPLAEVGLRAGSVVTLTERSEEFTTAGEALGAPPAALLRVLSGPDRGREYPLRSGSSVVGRAVESDVRLTDPLVSKRHLRVNVTSGIEIADLGSANGVMLAERQIQRESITTGDVVRIGDTEFTVVAVRTADENTAAEIGVSRSPRVVPRVSEVEVPAPEPPKQPQRGRFPWVAVIAPIFLGVGIYLVNPSLQSVLFVALGPILGIGAFIDQRITARRQSKADAARFAGALTALEAELARWQETERGAMLAAYPSLAQCQDAALRAGSVLWTRQLEHEEFASLRLGLGSVLSKVTVDMPTSNDTEPVHWQALQRVVERHVEIDDAPIVVALEESGALGVAGRPERRDPVAAALLAQLVITHSPADLALAVFASSDRQHVWQWTSWLPHVDSVHSPLPGSHLAADPGSTTSLLVRLEELVAERRATGPDGSARPLVAVLVEDDSPADRARLCRVAADGPQVGVHVIWCADTIGRLPAMCRTYVEVPRDATAVRVGDVRSGRVVDAVVDVLGTDDAQSLGRTMAPMVDLSAPTSDDSDLPHSVSYLELAGRDLVTGPAAIVERWHQTGSVEHDPRRRHEPTLRALVGQAGTDPLHLDLRTQGPHALVGGTTGAGKSEFLQSWVLGMASAYGPRRVTFLLVDYKGGTAFAECVDLPHFVGLVTDLTPHLVRRALTSLRAELRHREHVLNAAKAKDLIAMERAGHPDTPPALVIVVDEFAALVQEVPEFVDGMVDVAQRGRSLGLHLILATQRPAGVIKDNLRANTNLRVALRMADEDDSTDILGLPLAAHMDPSIPGRGAVKSGPGRVVPFQSGYAGGRTTDVPPPARIDISEMAFGAIRSWDLPERTPEAAADSGPTDISRLVDTIGAAASSLALPAPRRPWLDELASVYDLAKLLQRTDTELVLGVVDDPGQQRQVTAYWAPDVDGNLGVYGAGGAGKSSVLRTLAVAAAITPRGGPVHVYGLDFGSRGLSMLEQMPHVGSIVTGTDDERVRRLLRTLHAMLLERADRYAPLAASSISDYRRLAARPDEPRIVLLVDGIAGFREQYDTGRKDSVFPLFEQITSDGRAIGIHVVVTADRFSAVPPAIRSTLQRNVVLRMADENDYGSLDVPSDVLKTSSPPGRAVLDDLEIQIAVIGGSPSSAKQSTAIGRLVRSMPQTLPAPPVLRMPEEVALDSLPAGTAELLVLGVEERTLEPWGIVPQGTFLVVGAPGSGRTSALRTFAAAVERAVPRHSLVCIGPDRSPLRSRRWARAVNDGQADLVLTELAETAAEAAAGGTTLVLVIEDLVALSEAHDDVAQRAVRALVEHGHFVVADAELSRMTHWGQLVQLFKNNRRGMVLQPDASDADVFNADFPRTSRRDFPPGRGFVTERGQMWQLQLARGE